MFPGEKKIQIYFSTEANVITAAENWLDYNLQFFEWLIKYSTIG